MPAPALANTQWLETRMIHLHEHWPVGYVVGHTGVRGSPNGSVSGRWFATMMLTHWTFWPDGADTWDDPIPVPPLDAATLASFNGALLTAGSASTQATLQAAGPTSPIAEPTSPIGTSPPMSQQDSQSQPLAAQPLVQKSQPLKKIQDSKPQDSLSRETPLDAQVPDLMTVDPQVWTFAESLALPVFDSVPQAAEPVAEPEPAEKRPRLLRKETSAATVSDVSDFPPNDPNDFCDDPAPESQMPPQHPTLRTYNGEHLIYDSDLDTLVTPGSPTRRLDSLTLVQDSQQFLRLPGPASPGPNRSSGATGEECQRALDWPLRRGLAVARDIPLGPDTLIRAIDYP